MNIFAPDKRDLLAESPEDNCANHYYFDRSFASAYWGAINLARRLENIDYPPINPGAVAWQVYHDECSNLPSCH